MQALLTQGSGGQGGGDEHPHRDRPRPQASIDRIKVYRIERIRMRFMLPKRSFPKLWSQPEKDKRERESLELMFQIGVCRLKERDA